MMFLLLLWWLPAGCRVFSIVTAPLLHHMELPLERCRMDLTADLNQTTKHSLPSVLMHHFFKSGSSREGMISGIKSEYDYMFQKPKGLSNIDVSGAYFSTRDVLEGFRGCTYLSALLIAGCYLVSYICEVTALLRNGFPESFMRTHPASPKQSLLFVAWSHVVGFLQAHWAESYQSLRKVGSFTRHWFSL